MDKGVRNCTAKVYIADSLSCLCVCVCVFACGDDLQSSQREMDAHPYAKCARVPHVKHTADLCPSLDPLVVRRGRTKGRLTNQERLRSPPSPFLVNNGDLRA